MYKATIKMPQPIKRVHLVDADSGQQHRRQDFSPLQQQEWLELKARELEVREKELLLRSQLLVTNRANLQRLDDIKRVIVQLNEEMKIYIDRRGDQLRQLEERLVQLSLAIARKILFKEMENDKELIVRIIDKALMAVEGEKSITIELNPKDKENVSSLWDELDQTLFDGLDVELKENPHISQGGCKIVSALGTVDATLESRLEIIENVLKEGFENELAD